MDSLPDIVLVHIFSYLPLKPNPEALLVLRKVCRQWKNLIDTAEYLWSLTEITFCGFDDSTTVKSAAVRCLEVAPFLGALVLKYPSQPTMGMLYKILKLQPRQILKLYVKNIEQRDFSEVLSLCGDQLEELMIYKDQLSPEKLLIKHRLPKLRKLNCIVASTVEFENLSVSIPKLQELSVQMKRNGELSGKDILMKFRRQLRRITVYPSRLSSFWHVIPSFLNRTDYPQLQSISVQPSYPKTSQCSFKWTLLGNEKISLDVSGPMLLVTFRRLFQNTQLQFTAFQLVTHLNFSLAFQINVVTLPIPKYITAACSNLRQRTVTLSCSKRVNRSIEHRNFHLIVKDFVSEAVTMTPNLKVCCVRGCNQLLSSSEWKESLLRNFPLVHFDFKVIVQCNVGTYQASDDFPWSILISLIAVPAMCVMCIYFRY